MQIPTVLKTEVGLLALAIVGVLLLKKTSACQACRMRLRLRFAQSLTPGPV